MHSLKIELNQKLDRLKIHFSEFSSLESKYISTTNKSEKENLKIELFRLQNKIKTEASVELFQIFAPNTNWLWICEQITSDLNGTHLAINHATKHFATKDSL